MKHNSILKHLVLLSLTVILFSCNNLGKQINYDNLEIYYKDGISRQEASRAGDYLVKTGFKGDGSERKSVQLKKIGEKYLVRMVVTEHAENSPEYEKLFPRFASELSRNVFNGSVVEVHACSNTMKTLKIFEMETMDDWETYAGEGYEIKCPSTWELKESSSSNFDFSIFPKLPECADNKMQIKLMIEGLLYPMTIEQYIQLGLKALKADRDVQNFKLIETNYQKEGDIEQAEIIYTSSVDNDNFRVEQHYSIKNNTAYILTLINEANTNNEYCKKIAQDIMSTFTFTD